MVRNFIADYVASRKAGASKSKVGQDSDLLSLMLENTEAFKTDDDIVDTLIDVFCTGQLTSQYAMITALTHFTQKPDSKKKIRDFFKDLVQAAASSDPEVLNWSKSEKLKRLITFESVDEFEYLGHVLNETLRFQCPATQC